MKDVVVANYKPVSCNALPFEILNKTKTCVSNLKLHRLSYNVTEALSMYNDHKSFFRKFKQ